MSRSWSSAHDWKSCKGQKLFESSNLSISAMKNNPPPSGGGLFFISDGRDSKRARAEREKQAGGLFRCPCACRRGARAGRISPSPPLKKNPPLSGGGLFFISDRRDSKRARAKREKQAGGLFRCPCACRRGVRAGRISPSPPKKRIPHRTVGDSFCFQQPESRPCCIP